MTEPNITPLARRLAEENGIDWRALEGSGPDGTIVERDILAFLAKVMAGEVELPPQPEDAAPPEEIPDINQVQQALAREGVDLEELVPGITSETVPESAALEEEDVLFELDFDEEPPVEPKPETDFFAIDESAATAPEHPAEPPEPEPIAEELPPRPAPSPWEPAAEVVESPEETLEELEEDFSWEAAVEETAAPAEAAGEIAAEEPFDEAAGWEVIEEAEVGAEEAAGATPVEAAAVEPEAEEEVSPAEPEAQLGEPVSLESELEAEPEAAAAEAAEAPTQPVAYPPAFRRAVDLGALEKARSDLSEAWKKDVPPSLLLFRAVERALAELEVPMRPVLGRLRGEGVESLMVFPADNLRALYDHFQTAGEPAEGLVVIDLGETPYAEVLIPDTPLVTLGYSGMPAGMALLSVSGELPTDRTRFLERVAFYLERPILLA